jgi:hypothetical protein
MAVGHGHSIELRMVRYHEILLEDTFKDASRALILFSLR